MLRANPQKPCCIIFQPKAFLPAQEGPLCFFYSLSRVMQFQSDSYLQEIPKHCLAIVDQIREVDIAETINLDEKIDAIFEQNLSDAIIQDLNLTNDDEPIETVEDFMSEYPHSYAMGLLMGFKLTKQLNLKQLSFDDYVNYLRIHGPITFDGEFSIDLDLDLLPTATQLESDQARLSIYPANQELMDGQHTILMIGCQKSPMQEVYYIDPNYPDLILSIPFGEFKRKIVDSGNGIIFYQSDVKPTIDNIKNMANIANYSLSASKLSVLGKHSASNPTSTETNTLPENSSFKYPKNH